MNKPTNHFTGLWRVDGFYLEVAPGEWRPIWKPKYHNNFWEFPGQNPTAPDNGELYFEGMFTLTSEFTLPSREPESYVSQVPYIYYP